MFSCQFWEISKNAFFTEHLWATASGLSNKDSFASSIDHIIGQKQSYQEERRGNIHCVLQADTNNQSKYTMNEIKWFSLSNLI